MTRVAIVGSRRRTDASTVERYVATLPASTVIVSGGAKGPDTWARDAARKHGLQVIEHLPKLDGVRSRGEATRRYYERNQLIAEDCDRVVALVADDRKGGTEDTIRRALELGKPVELI